MTSDDVRCSDTELRLLRPLDEMSTAVRRATTRWLWAHGITPSTVALGLAIERDEAQNALVWREQHSGDRVVKRWRFAPQESLTRWPAAFPAALLEAGATPSRAVRDSARDARG